MAKNPAAVAYEAYREHVNCLDFGPRAIMLQPWDELGPDFQKAWWAAVLALLEEIKPRPELQDD